MNDLERRVAEKQGLAWLALFWERFWPAIWPAIAIIAVFIALALMGAPAAFGGWPHVALLVLAALALLLGLRRGLSGLRAPTGEEARRRLETESGLQHRPLTVIEDRLSPTADRASQALWNAHVRRMREAIRRLRVGWPRPGLGRRDVYALRAIVFLALIVGLSAAGRDGFERIARAFTPDLSPPPAVPARLDAWINPPQYTGMAPFQLNAEVLEGYRLPAGSILLARVYGGRGQPQLEIGRDRKAFETVDRLNHELEYKIEGGERLTVRQEDRLLGDWPVEVVPDRIPTIGLSHTPGATERGVLRLDFTAADDYGLMGARAEFRLAQNDRGEVLARPLPLPALGAREAAESSFHDLTPHPWAGMEVMLRLVAVDGLEQTGESIDFRFTLPERQFRHPVARAVIEQRKNLVRAPEARRMISIALEAIAEAPETYDDDVVVSLALSAAAARLKYDRVGSSVAPVIDLLWDTALRIEDGRLSLAERELREIQQQLMDALARDADESEIERLMDRLQEAMQRYLQALAEQAMQRAREGEQPLPYDPEARTIDSEQLQQMLERARELSRLGARDAARELLRQLQEMLENLRSGPMMAMPPEMRGADQAIRDLGNLMRDQQQLMDRTFRQSPRARERGLTDRGQRGEQQGRDPSRGMEGMSDEQEALRRRLGEVMRQLGEQMGDIPGALGRAERAMRDARESLSEGQAGEATEFQGRAIDQLAEGMRGLAQEMARQMGRGQGNELEGGPFEEDPLGRPSARGGMDTSTVEIPDKADVQRAREILDELRRRAGEGFRPELELEYIDRLLKRF